MATEPAVLLSGPHDTDVVRRRLLQLVASASLGGALVGQVRGQTQEQTPEQMPRTVRMATAWRNDEGQNHVGVLTGATPAVWSVAARIPVPTRAHACCLDPAGTVLSVARRPGDWLLRWHPHGHVVQWYWAETDRTFNGHVLLSPDGQRVYTTETRQDTGEGLVGVRDARTLEKLAEWPVHGVDPHELVWMHHAVKGELAGALLVANGGIAVRPETGRQKVAQANMDSSLVAVRPDTGGLVGRWRVRDPWLSLRHLAWHAAPGATGPVLGVALQAEHAQSQIRHAAPVLALWHPQHAISQPDLAFRMAEQPHAMAGYGGDIDSVPDGFLVASPKVGLVGRWRPDGQWLGGVEWPQACALAAREQTWWCGGDDRVLAGGCQNSEAGERLRGVHIDNHCFVFNMASLV